MARTGLIEDVRGLVAGAAAAEGDRAALAVGLTRRQLLGGALGGAGLLAVGGASRRAGAATDGRIVIVGGGLAGLTCAYRLRQAGQRATVYDANTRFGGRCWTLRNAFEEGQTVERGGELIDTGHTEIRQLAQELGLDLDNLLRAEQNGTEPFFWFDGAAYTAAEASRDLRAVWQKIKSDLSAASYPTLYNSSTPRGRELDAMSIDAWIQESVPGGLGSRLGQLLSVAYNIEYGAETRDQSALNLLYLLGYSGQGQLRIFGPSNEKYRVRGGNDLVVEGLVRALEGQLIGGAALTALARQSDGTWRLSLRQGSTTSTVAADRVVLALPFSILRGLDLRRAGFSAAKLRAVNELGTGRNAKLQLQFRERVWRAQGKNGDTYADTGYQATWEVTRAQPGTAGILVGYTGGDTAQAMGSGTPASRAAAFLSQLEPVVPGITGRWNGLSQLDWWPGSPYVRGSYSYWRVGQYTTIAGLEGLRQGTCHFAGEHTSIDYQGYLNGAVESGERAAREILSDLKG